MLAVEMSCPWIDNRMAKDKEKTTKYAALRWELKQQYRGYEVKQCNVIIDVLGGWSEDLNAKMEELVGERTKQALKCDGFNIIEL